MTKVVTGKVRFSFPVLFAPKAAEEGDKEKYSICLIIPKSDKATIKKIRKAIDNAAEAGAGKFKGGKIPKNLKTPLRDGDTERPDQPEFENSFFLNASSIQKPGVVDKDLEPILDKEEVYAGSYGRASIHFYAFNVGKNQGIAAGLSGIQKLTDGERLGGGGFDVDDFDDGFEFEDDDDDLY